MGKDALHNMTDNMYGKKKKISATVKRLRFVGGFFCALLVTKLCVN